MTHQEAMDLLNELWAKVVPQQAGYTFWSNPHNDRFFYTTEKVRHRGKARYLSGVYRYVKSRKGWKLLYEAGNLYKRNAMDRAYKLLQADLEKRGEKAGHCWTCGRFSGVHYYLIDLAPGIPGGFSARVCDDCRSKGNVPADAELTKGY